MSDTSKILFQGTQEAIEMVIPQPGGLYFGTDTGKLYLAVLADEEDDRFEGIEMKQMNTELNIDEDGNILDDDGNIAHPI